MVDKKDNLVKAIEKLIAFTDEEVEEFIKPEFKFNPLNHGHLIEGVFGDKEEILPSFLYKNGEGIYIGVNGDTNITEEWNKYKQLIK